MTTQQPEALRLADICATKGLFAVEDELRRLHAESELHLQELRSYRIAVENREARIAELEARVQELEASQARVPLSDEQIESLLISWPEDGIAFFDFARAIEAAHGIKQEKQV